MAARGSKMRNFSLLVLLFCATLMAIFIMQQLQSPSPRQGHGFVSPAIYSMKGNSDFPGGVPFVLQRHESTEQFNSDVQRPETLPTVILQPVLKHNERFKQPGPLPPADEDRAGTVFFLKAIREERLILEPNASVHSNTSLPTPQILVQWVNSFRKSAEHPTSPANPITLMEAFERAKEALHASLPEKIIAAELNFLVEPVNGRVVAHPLALARAVLWGTASNTSTRKGVVHICGYPPGLILASALFPERALRWYNTVAASADDILVTGGRCKIKGFPGTILYWDPEQGMMQIQMHPRIVFLGLADPPKIDAQMRKGIMAMIPHFHVATTTLFHKYTANDFLQRPSADNRTRFLVYAQSNCVAFREEAFDSLVHLSRKMGWDEPVAKGRCTGSLPKSSESFSGGKSARLFNSETLSEFKFVLAMENNYVEGYITEKVANAFMAGGIPIYYGTIDVFKLFNKDAFIFWNISSPGNAIDTIIHLQSNPSAYAEMASRPMLANGQHTLEEYFSLSDDVGGGKLKQRIRSQVLKPFA